VILNWPPEQMAGDIKSKAAKQEIVFRALFMVLFEARVKSLSIVQKCLLNGILVRERAHTYLCPAMPIFSRRYLLAWEEVAKYVEFR
jgi:hypothetical protein